MRIGFLVWNEFQFYQFRSVLDRLPNAILFIDMRLGWHRRFPSSVLVGLKNPIVRLKHSNLRPIGSMVEVLVVQSNTNARVQLPNVRIVAMQYSLSKEWHQYGSWMRDADLALCFGQYSREKLGETVPAEIVGNPRMDDYFAGRLDSEILEQKRAALDPSKPTIMLAPSWNDAKAVSKLEHSRHELVKRYNVLWSPHHNTRIFQYFMQRIFARNKITVDEYLYSLKLADVLVSDTSGALFDAIHAGKHVVIADLCSQGSNNLESIEFNQRDKIGPVARSVEQLGDLCVKMISGDFDYKRENDELRASCFCCDGGAAQKVVAALKENFTDK
jgi:hypothetical protein